METIVHISNVVCYYIFYYPAGDWERSWWFHLNQITNGLQKSGHERVISIVKPSSIKRREVKAKYLNFIPYKRIYSNLAMSGYYLVKPSSIKRREVKAQHLNFIPFKRIYSNLAMSGYYLVKPSPIKRGRDQSVISKLYTLYKRIYSNQRDRFSLYRARKREKHRRSKRNEYN